MCIRDRTKFVNPEMNESMEYRAGESAPRAGRDEFPPLTEDDAPPPEEEPPF